MTQQSKVPLWTPERLALLREMLKAETPRADMVGPLAALPGLPMSLAAVHGKIHRLKTELAPPPQPVLEPVPADWDTVAEWATRQRVCLPRKSKLKIINQARVALGLSPFELTEGFPQLSDRASPVRRA
jgi:hypothetical protein